MCIGLWVILLFLATRLTWVIKEHQQRSLSRERAWIELCYRQIILAAVWRNEWSRKRMMAGNIVITFYIFQVSDDKNFKDSDNYIGLPMATVTAVKNTKGLKNLHVTPDHVMPTLVAQYPCLLSPMGSSTPSSDMSLHVITMSASNSFSCAYLTIRELWWIYGFGIGPFRHPAHTQTQWYFFTTITFNFWSQRQAVRDRHAVTAQQIASLFQDE